MLPVSYHYGGWPRSGEIDIMESRGNEFETNYYICIMAIHVYVAKMNVC